MIALRKCLKILIPPLVILALLTLHEWSLSFATLDSPLYLLFALLINIFCYVLILYIIVSIIVELFIFLRTLYNKL